MSIAEVKRSYTPTDLLAMPDAVNYELVEGELVERNMSYLSSFVEGRVFEVVQSFVRKENLGHVLPGTLGFQCFRNRPHKIRRPDVSFIRSSRISADLFLDGYCPIAPDLAVEVVSPNDLAHEVNEKIEEYFGAGVRLIWIVDPVARVVDVYRMDGANSRLRENDILDGGNLLPGFQCMVKDLFPERSETPASVPSQVDG